MANAKTATPTTEPTRQEMLDAIVAQLRAQRSAPSGLALTDRLVSWAADKAADSTEAASRIGAGFVSGWDNGKTAYAAERERQLLRRANKMLALAEASV